MEEILQLLTHSDKNNKLLGVMLAWSQGWGTLDIFDKLAPIVKRETCTIYQVGNFAFTIEQFQSYSFEKKYNYIGFLIVDDKDVLNSFKVDYSKTKKKKYTKRFAHIFMEYILDGV